jgi:hypothetical protein
LELLLTITPDFTFFDYNRDGVKELITKTIVYFGACPITKTYYSAYHFSKNGMRQLDSWFNGSIPAIEQEKGSNRRYDRIVVYAIDSLTGGSL